MSEGSKRCSSCHHVPHSRGCRNAGGASRARARVHEQGEGRTRGPILEARATPWTREAWDAEHGVIGDKVFMNRAYGDWIGEALKPQVMVSVHPRFTLPDGLYASLSDRALWFYRQWDESAQVVHALQASLRGGKHSHDLICGKPVLARVKWAGLWADLRQRIVGMVGEGQPYRVARVGVRCSVCDELHDGLEERPRHYTGELANTGFVNFKTNDGGDTWGRAFGKYVSRYITREEADTWVNL